MTPPSDPTGPDWLLEEPRQLFQTGKGGGGVRRGGVDLLGLGSWLSLTLASQKLLLLTVSSTLSASTGTLQMKKATPLELLVLLVGQSSSPWPRP